MLRWLNGADGADQTDGFGLVITGINHLLFDTQKLLLRGARLPSLHERRICGQEVLNMSCHKRAEDIFPKGGGVEGKQRTKSRGDADVLQIASAQDVFIENCHIASRLQAVEQQMRDMKGSKSVDSRLQAVEQQMRDMNTLLARLAGAALPAHS